MHPFNISFSSILADLGLLLLNNFIDPSFFQENVLEKVTDLAEALLAAEEVC